jgi:hypothetical protein
MAAAGDRLDYYIYYRLRAGLDEVAAHEVVRAMQAGLAARFAGLRPRLLQRTNDARTWMEIYPDVADAAAFEAALEEAVATRRLGRLLEDGAVRHLECFHEGR